MRRCCSWLAGGSPTYINRLILETSPYLLQHAHNPVTGYAWGDEAFERAKCENKPVLLSVGDSTCHWCHVMERESFEDLLKFEPYRPALMAVTVGLLGIGHCRLWRQTRRAGIECDCPHPRVNRMGRWSLWVATCASCTVAVKTGLTRLDGVLDAKVSKSSGQAVARCDASKVTPQQMAEAVSKAGYPAQVASS